MVTLWEVTVVLPLGSRGSSARHTPVQSEPWRQLVLIQVKTSGQLNMHNVKHTIYQVDNKSIKRYNISYRIIEART